MINYWYPYMDMDYDEVGSWFGPLATAKRLRCTRLGHARTKWKVPVLIYARAYTSFVRRYVSATGM